MTTHPTHDTELLDFKTQINLTLYAADQGYLMDRRSSSVNSVCMKHPNGDKILISMAEDGHWIYCSVSNLSDNGSIIDFVQNRQGQACSLGRVRMHLRPYIGNPPTLDPLSYVQEVKPVVVDLKAVRERYDQMTSLAGYNAYLSQERGIPEAVYNDTRFEGRIRTDSRNNVVMPHWNAKGKLCGYEAKNQGFTGFAKGGMKGLFGSRAKNDDVKLVIGETGIDLLSYAALFGLDKTRFISTAGTLNPHQPALLRSAMLKLPDQGIVIAATDNDSGGEALAEHIQTIYEAIRRPEIAFNRHSPPTVGQDWNDVLRASQKPIPPTLPKARLYFLNVLRVNALDDATLTGCNDPHNVGLYEPDGREIRSQDPIPCTVLCCR